MLTFITRDPLVSSLILLKTKVLQLICCALFVVFSAKKGRRVELVIKKDNIGLEGLYYAFRTLIFNPMYFRFSLVNSGCCYTKQKTKKEIFLVNHALLEAFLFIISSSCQQQFFIILLYPLPDYFCC